MTNEITNEVRQYRKAGYPIDPIFINRWSPRALSGEVLSVEELMPLFEAARWAPSSYNAQQWRFLYARRDTSDWDKFYDLLTENNKSWAKNAAVLIVVISRKYFEHNEKPSRTHLFDTGAAWENLALEGTRRGLVVHGMQGFDYDQARNSLKVPENFDVCAMVAIGKRGKTGDLPEKYRAAEKPNSRRPLNEIAIEGVFRGK